MTRIVHDDKGNPLPYGAGPQHLLLGAVIGVVLIAICSYFNIWNFNGDPSPSYHGAPVAGFTTGGQSCSPICGHR